MPLYVFDIIIVVLVILFAWRGATKGLVLSLCGLVASFVAFFGAQIISYQFTAPVADLIHPFLQEAVDQVELPELKLPDSLTGAGVMSEAEKAITKEDLLKGLEDADLPDAVRSFVTTFVNGEGFDQALEDLQKTPSFQLPENPLKAVVDTMVNSLAESIARIGLFAVSFLLILLVWFLLSHALDLAFHLPILSQLNLAGGLIFGAAEALVICVIGIAIAQALGYLPAEPDTPILSMLTIDALTEMLGSVDAAAVSAAAG